MLPLSVVIVIIGVGFLIWKGWPKIVKLWNKADKEDRVENQQDNVDTKDIHTDSGEV